MLRRQNIRNISVINHNHTEYERASFIDILASKVDVITTHEGEIDECHGTIRPISIISRYFELQDHDLRLIKGETQYEEGEKSFMVNFMRLPELIDSAFDATADLCITDGVLVVVDCLDGVGIQTETLLRRAIMKRIKPVVFVDQIDLAMTALQLNSEDLYAKFLQIVDKINVTIETYSNEVESMDNFKINPSEGMMAFGSLREGWAFTLQQIAELQACQVGLGAGELSEKLWGENYFNRTTREWSEVKSECNERAFNIFAINQPIETVKTSLDSMSLGTSEIGHKHEEQEALKIFMQKNFPIEHALAQMVVVHLPSPVTAQNYRMDLLYDGPHSDEAAVAIKNCDPNSPLMIYIAKLFPCWDRESCYAIGRVLSGTATPNQSVRVMGPNYVSGSKFDLHEATIQQLVITFGRKTKSVDSVPAGNICALFGISQCLMKTGTVTTFRDAAKLRASKFNQTPVLKVAVQPEDAIELPRLIRALSLSTKSDPSFWASFDETIGEHYVAGGTELHINSSLNNLKACAAMSIITSEPIVEYREGVNEKSSMLCCSKSSDGLVEVHMKASPLEPGLDNDIERGLINPSKNCTSNREILVEKYKWSASDSLNIWSFAPESTGPNLLVDVTKGIQYSDQARDCLIQSFQLASKSGALCGEQCRSIRWDIHHAELQVDADRDSLSQKEKFTQAIRRCFHASQLTARPSLIEPIYLVEIHCPNFCVGWIYGIMTRRRGRILEENEVSGTPMLILNAYLPVNESFGFAADVKKWTEGQAISQCVFDHWQFIASNPLDEESKSGRIIKAVRSRKGLRGAVPNLDDYIGQI